LHSEPIGFALAYLPRERGSRALRKALRQKGRSRHKTSQLIGLSGRLSKPTPPNNLSESIAMIDEQLRDKLRKIEALFAGAATDGERLAAGAAAERIREKLSKSAQQETASEIKFSIPDLWSRQLFVALCRRYGIQPFRYRRMHQQSIVIRAPRSFIETVLWPEFEELSAVLTAYLSDITEQIIREEVHGDTGDAEERTPQRKIKSGE
jgi:hypothetical protein